MLTDEENHRINKMILEDSKWRQITTKQFVRKIKLDTQITLNEITNLVTYIKKPAPTLECRITWSMGWPNGTENMLTVHAMAR